MNYLTSIIDSIAWPVTVIILFLVFKKPIFELILYAKKLKYKNFEIIFDKKINEIVKDAHNDGLEINLPKDESEYINKLIEISPTSAVLESWKEIEIAAKNKIEELLAEEDPLARKRPLAHLEYLGTFIPSVENAIFELRDLRNRIAHSNDILISVESAKKYVSLAKNIVQKIEAISELPSQKLIVLTLLILEYNSLIDSGKYSQITIKDIHKEIENKNVLNYLKKVTGEDSDFSLFLNSGPYVKYVDEYYEKLHGLYEGYAGDEGKKWGVRNSGLCLLIAWTNEIIQQGSGWYPDNQ
jgi:hypothetical protein